MYLVSKENIKIFLKVNIIIFLFLLLPQITQAANLSVSKAVGNFEVGDYFSVKVTVSDNNVLFNAVSAVVSFPASLFKVESVSKANSVLNFWVTEPVSASNTVKFEGVALGGFTGFTGTVVTINFRAIAPGTGTIGFISGQVLANDGQGTDITNNLIGAQYIVKEAVSVPEVQKEKKIEVKKEEVETIEEVQPAPTLASPEIVLSSKYGVPAILGTSIYGNAEVLVTFVASDGAKVFIVGKAEADGSFTLLVPKSLKHGVYSVSAVMIKQDKTNSNISNTITITVGSIFSDISKEIWGAIGLLICSIIYLFIRIYLHFSRDKSIHKIIKNEVVETEALIHKSFEILRDDIGEVDNKKISASEHKHMAELKKDIDAAEEVINKEVGGIK